MGAVESQAAEEEGSEAAEVNAFEEQGAGTEEEHVDGVAVDDLLGGTALARSREGR